MNKKTIYLALFLSLTTGLIIYRLSPIHDQKTVPAASILTAQVFTNEAPPAPSPPSPPPAPTPPASPQPPSTAPSPSRDTPSPSTSDETTSLRPAAPPAPETPPLLSFLRDTDNDGFSDRTEIDIGTDPESALSYPPDENRNGTDDVWEQKFGIIINDGGEDTDQDGVSDKLEYMHGTDPLKNDSDNDTFSDAREILELKTNGNDAEDPGTLQKIGIRITSFENNQSISDPQPFIKGVAPNDTTIEIALFNDKKEERILGQTLTHENNIFIFLAPEILNDGGYDLVARIIEPPPRQGVPPPPKPNALLHTPIARAQELTPTQANTQANQPNKARAPIIMESVPVHVKINKTLNVTPPNPQKLADQAITEENLLKDLRVEIIDNKPVLLGKTAFNSEVIATWHSIVLTSALIADSPRGEFSISAFHSLGTGDHEVYVQAVRLKDNAVSKTIKVPFTIVPPAPPKIKVVQPPPAPLVQAPTPAAEEPAKEELKAAAETTSALTDLLSGKYGIYFWPVALLAALAIITNIFTLLGLRKKKKTPPPPSAPKSPPKNENTNTGSHFLQNR